jgi:polyhydroxybutyrate depolymerase
MLKTEKRPKRITGNVKPAFYILVLVIMTIAPVISSCVSIEPVTLTEHDFDTRITTGNITVYLPPVLYDYSASIIHDEIERTYIVHIGRSYVPENPVPLIFVLHGGGGSGNSMPGYTGFNAIADRENFILVYPDGIENHWNDGRESNLYTTFVENTDDVGFISALIDRLLLDLNIDTERIYATGISNGGMMAHRLGCELSDRIAAIAPVAASIPANMGDIWNPSGRISVLVINGTDDPLVPWEGGDIIIGDEKIGTALSVDETMEFWSEKNGCTAEPIITQLSERVADDGTSVQIEAYLECADGADVVLYRVINGGHTWPGSSPYAPESVIGKTSCEFDASEIIWQFFEDHTMK